MPGGQLHSCVRALPLSYTFAAAAVIVAGQPVDFPAAATATATTTITTLPLPPSPQPPPPPPPLPLPPPPPPSQQQPQQEQQPSQRQQQAAAAATADAAQAAAAARLDSVTGRGGAPCVGTARPDGPGRAPGGPQPKAGVWVRAGAAHGRIGNRLPKRAGALSRAAGLEPRASGRTERLGASAPPGPRLVARHDNANQNPGPVPDAGTETTPPGAN